MNVQELIEVLSQMPKGAEVRLATQPNYPFQNYISDVVLLETEDECEDCGCEWADHEEMGCDGPDYPEEIEPTVYIGDGGQVHDRPYLPGNATNLLGW